MSIDRAPTVGQIPGPVGPLEALLTEPLVGPDGDSPHPRGAVVFGHPHPQFGGTMHTKVVYQAAKAFARIGCATLRFNFRGVGLSAGVWDDGRGEQDDYRAALDFAAARYPNVELWTAGFSFGAWIALSVGAADPRVCALIGIALPVDTKPEYDLSAVVTSMKPKFLIHGERDELIPLTRMWTVYGQMEEPKELVVIDAANYLFDGHVSEVGDAIEDLLGDFHAVAAQES